MSNDTSSRSPIEDILRHPPHAMRNRAHLSLLLGRFAKIDDHFDVMIKTARSTPEVASNPDYAAWRYVQKLKIHKRDFRNNLGPQKVFFEEPKGAPKASLTLDGQKSEFPMFLQLHYYNEGSSPTAMAKHIFRCTPSATSMKIEHVSEAVLHQAIESEKAARRLAAEARRQEEEAQRHAEEVQRRAQTDALITRRLPPKQLRLF